MEGKGLVGRSESQTGRDSLRFPGGVGNGVSPDLSCNFHTTRQLELRLP